MSFIKNKTAFVTILAFASIYIIWGSTFLAISFGLEGFPPFILSGFRFFIAGLLLFVWRKAKNETAASVVAWKKNAITGILILTGGTGLVAWGEQYVSSTEAAIAIAKDPSRDLAAKRAAITQLVADTRRKVTDSLGAEAGEAYLKRGNIHWLTNLEKGHISVQIDENSWTGHSIEQLAAESQTAKK